MSKRFVHAEVIGIGVPIPKTDPCPGIRAAFSLEPGRVWRGMFDTETGTFANGVYSASTRRNFNNDPKNAESWNWHAPIGEIKIIE